MSYEKRKAHFKWLDSNNVVITNLFKQKRFHLTKPVTIDLISLTIVPDAKVIDIFETPIIASFFADFFYKEGKQAFDCFIYGFCSPDEYKLLGETNPYKDDDLSVEVKVWVDD